VVGGGEKGLGFGGKEGEEGVDNSCLYEEVIIEGEGGEGGEDLAHEEEVGEALLGCLLLVGGGGGGGGAEGDQVHLEELE